MSGTWEETPLCRELQSERSLPVTLFDCKVRKRNRKARVTIPTSTAIFSNKFISNWIYYHLVHCSKQNQNQHGAIFPKLISLCKMCDIKTTDHFKTTEGWAQWRSTMWVFAGLWFNRKMPTPTNAVWPWKQHSREQVLHSKMLTLFQTFLEEHTLHWSFNLENNILSFNYQGNYFL